jgi:hypothetical protein
MNSRVAGESTGDGGGDQAVAVKHLLNDRTNGLRRDNAPEINMIERGEVFTIIEQNQAIRQRRIFVRL